MQKRQTGSSHLEGPSRTGQVVLVSGAPIQEVMSYHRKIMNTFYMHIFKLHQTPEQVINMNIYV